MKLPALNIRNLTRKQRIVFGAGGLVVVLVSVVLCQYFAWQRYIERNDARYAEARGDALQQLRHADQPESIQTLEHAILEGTARDLCKAPALAGVYIKVVGGAGAYQRACEQRSSKLLRAADYARQLSKRIFAEQQIASTLKKTNDGLKASEEGAYAAQQKLWQQARSDLSKLSVDGTYSEALQSLLAAIDVIVERYDGLIGADETKERNQFDDAAVDLREAYGALEAISEDSKVSYRALTEKLYDAVNEL